MSCSLLDIGCHAVQVGADLWGGFSLPSKALIIAGLLSIVGGALWGAAKAIKAFGGWPAVAGAGLVLAGLMLAAWPKAGPASAPKATPKAGSKVGAKPEFQFGVDRTKKRRRTIFHAWE